MIIIYILLCWISGGFDWIIDMYECFLINKEYLFIDNITMWEPDFSSYQNWVNSMLIQDPTYEITEELTKQNYLEAKYFLFNDLEDSKMLFLIQEEFLNENENMENI